MFVWSRLTFFCFKFFIPKMTMKKTNIVRLTPLNPNVSLGKVDILQRPMFPSDDKLKILVTSD